MHDNCLIEANNKPEIINFYNKTKAGVDTLDKMCMTYTTGRATRRWPLCLFYCIIDIAAINSYVIYKHYFPYDKRSLYRREFIKDLGTKLVYDFMTKRLYSTNLPIELRLVIERVSGVKSPVIQPTNQLSIKKYVNNTRCDLCKGFRERKASIRCEECERLVCKQEHVVYYCTQCKNDDYLANDQ